MKQLNILIKQTLQFGTLAAFELFIKSRGARITNRILKNKNKNKTKLEHSNLPDLKTCYSFSNQNNVVLP